MRQEEGARGAVSQQGGLNHGFSRTSGSSVKQSAQATTYRCNKEKFPGPERVFRVDVARPGKVRVRLFSEGKSKLALRWLSSPDPDRCEARARARLDVNVTPGPRWLVVESASEAEAGNFALTLLHR